MKASHILLTIALVFCATYQVSAQIDIASLFGAGAGPISPADLTAIFAAPDEVRVNINKFLFLDADTNGDGYLSLAEFTPVYTRFVQIMTGGTPSPALIQSRFNMGDSIINDNRLSFPEFSFLMGLDFTFLFLNLGLRTGPGIVLDGILTVMDALFSNPLFTTGLNLLLTGAEVDLALKRSIIEFIANFVGIDLGFTDCILNNLLGAADANGDGTVTNAELINFLPNLIGDLAELLRLNADPALAFFC